MAQAGDKASRQRPLSPHIQIYGWSWTMVMSGFHRATGFALYFGMGLFALWLVLLTTPSTNELAYWLVSNIIGWIVPFGFSWGLIHHLLGGIRHFIWDMGKGFDPVSRRNMAIYTLVGSTTLTLLLWVVGFMLTR
ncbi:succinate dehydrogenase, cytochrome b556 subunit [Microvirga sp. W0021]|uniref:Succinate dehydrogenase cytochrome b556 subunit n=1 Tax=Hohaiivirga grylli TaxID=3133970 RepID=A0ABV0BKM1_9HYPH